MNIGKIKNTNFINIQGFMRNQLKLTNNKLLVYALIYGFTQDGESWFTGSLEYIAQWIGKDRKNIYPRYLKPLVDENLLEKKDEIVNGIKYVKYRAIVPKWVEINDCTQNEDTIFKNDGRCTQNEKETVLKMRDNNISLNNLNTNIAVNEKQIKDKISSRKENWNEAYRTDEYSNKAEQFMIDSFNCFSNENQIRKINSLSDEDLKSLFDIALGLVCKDPEYSKINNNKKFYSSQIKNILNNVE